MDIFLSIEILVFYFLGAIEKQKLVYIINRDSETRLTISSPLEAHKSNTLVYHMVGVDMAFENPYFACLEIDYEVNEVLIFILRKNKNILIVIILFKI